MRLLGKETACTRLDWCSAVKHPTVAPLRPSLPRKLHQPRQLAGENSCSKPEAELFWMPDTDGAPSSKAESDHLSSFSSVRWQQLSYRDFSQRLQPLCFVEMHEEIQDHQYRVQLGEPPQQDQQKENKDYYANVGDCIRTLREDIPLLFAKDLNYTIYREDIVFKDSRISFQGLRNYKTVIWSLRFHGKLFFKQPYVEVMRIWQPEDNLIKMRWAVHGSPRLSWTEPIRYQFDGISTYKLDKKGQINEHGIDNVQLRDPPITNPLLYAWNIFARPLVPQQTPCPGAWFKDEAEKTLSGGVASAGQQ